jgi:tripartite-type tricarboxylate transporter receptor subunit TctC
MRFPFLAAALCFGVTMAFQPAKAEYPERIVKIQLGFPAGGGADILARYYADKLQKLTGGNFIVENRVGASGNLAIDAAGRSKPDGYNILLASTVTTAGNASVFKQMPLDVTKDIVPIV